jgi:hypothetical protein
MLPAAELRSRIESFLSRCAEPCLLEPGEKGVAVVEPRYSLDLRDGGVVFHVWGDDGNIVRRISGIAKETRNRLDLRARRFGRPELVVSLIDRAKKGTLVDRQETQAEFRERLRRMLARDFAEWQLERLSSSPDLERSFSALCTRGVLRRGKHGWAMIGVGREAGAAAADGALTFGLIWLDYLRQSEPGVVFHGLRLFLPAGQTEHTAHRLRFLNRLTFRFELFSHDRKDRIVAVDPADTGNLATGLQPCLAPPSPAEPVSGWLNQLAEVEGIEIIPRTDGLLSLRINGIPFGAAGRGVMTYGLKSQVAVTEERFPRVLRLARELARFRHHASVDQQNPLYRDHPERWLEAQVRRNLGVIDSRLSAKPVYTHVPAIAGASRGIIDLLARGVDGRLAVIELKAQEDIHLPLQGLDYWLRVKWHLDREDFSKLGYFSRGALSGQPPRLLLVSPGVHFHPSTETILKYFSPEVEVERVGVASDWRRELSVAFRRRGAGRMG